MSFQTGYRRLEVEDVGGVTVVTFRFRQILSEAAVQALSQHLQRLVAGSDRRLLLNFSNVERLSSAVLGSVVALNRAVRQAGGKLALCGLRQDLFYLFTITRLDRQLDLYASEGEALQDLL